MREINKYFDNGATSSKYPVRLEEIAGYLNELWTYGRSYHSKAFKFLKLLKNKEIFAKMIKPHNS